MSDVRSTTAEPSTIETIGESPIALLIGGIALGVVVGMILPRLQRERELLEPLATRVASSAGAAVQAAREASKAEIEGLIPDKDQAKERVSQLLESVVGAAREAATAK
jgi:hypothetical protein